MLTKYWSIMFKFVKIFDAFGRDALFGRPFDKILLHLLK